MGNAHSSYTTVTYTKVSPKMVNPRDIARERRRRRIRVTQAPLLSDSRVLFNWDESLVINTGETAASKLVEVQFIIIYFQLFAKLTSGWPTKVFPSCSGKNLFVE